MKVVDVMMMMTRQGKGMMMDVVCMASHGWQNDGLCVWKRKTSIPY